MVLTPSLRSFVQTNEKLVNLLIPTEYLDFDKWLM